MSNQFRSFEQINVQSPCNQEWDAMTGNDRVRFCSHCQLTVNNISAMSDKDVRRLLATAKGRLCVRYHQPANLPQARRALPQLHHIIGRRASKIAPGAFTAALSLSAAAVQQANGNQLSASPGAITFQTTPLNSLPDLTGSIVGTVLTPAGQPIDGATIVISNTEKNLVLSVSSDSKGNFGFPYLEPGLYNVRIQAVGFALDEVIGIYVSPNNEQRIDRTLQSDTSSNSEEQLESKEVSVVMGGMAMAMAEDPLVRAAQEDNIEKVQQALLDGAKINNRDKVTDSTALDFAAKNGNREILQLLITNGAHVNSTSSTGQTPLMLLSEQATRDMVSDLITAGAKVNLEDNDGDTALGQAAAYHDSDVLKALLDAGAKVNEQNKLGQTALMRAAERNRMNNVRLLLHAGADFNLRDKEGKTALAYARAENNAAVIRLLSSYGGAEGTAVNIAKEQ